MKYIAVITNEKSDFCTCIESIAGVYIEYIKVSQISDYNLDLYDALCILGGTAQTPLILPPKSRRLVEKQIENGKKIFAEYVLSIGNIYSAPQISTRFKRLLYVGENKILNNGDILEDQCNSFISSYYASEGATPILIYKDFVNAHSNTVVLDDDKNDVKKWALWFESNNLLICNFRLCNMVKARFSPYERWNEIIRFIIHWITGQNSNDIPRIYKTTDENSVEDCVAIGIKWFTEAKMILDNGNGGVLEGLGTEVYPNGEQKLATSVRTDCSAEVALAYFADYMLTGNQLSLQKSDNLEKFCYENMQINGGIHSGMFRWTDIAWGVCYQDDTARVLFMSLMKSLYTGSKKYLAECTNALNFLLKTTGTDGLRVIRTDNITLNQDEMNKLKSEAANLKSAHYNAFYLATLLICGKLTDNTIFINAGIKGLETIMEIYPQTMREQSETQELCRLIMPLSWLYFVTHESKHKKWLYTVTSDLQKMKHSSGGYLEWDSDYSANCSRTENGECSLLINNGDPIVDFIYSQNWLPMGFLQAYLVTKDNMFLDLLNDISSFFVKTQLHSSNPLINGAWARGFDVDLFEVYGNPNDVGWGPWAVETGWTMGNILSGLSFGLLYKKLSKFY